MSNLLALDVDMTTALSFFLPLFALLYYFSNQKRCQTWVQKIQAPKAGSINGKVFPGWIEDHIDLSQFTYLEVGSKSEFFKIVLKYGVEYCVSSFIPQMEKTEDEEGCEKTQAKLVLGHGLHEGMYKGKRLIIARFTIGNPVGTLYEGAVQKDVLVLFMEGYNQQDGLKEYLEDLLERERSEPPKNKFRVYRWNVCQGYWYMESLQKARKLKSVVLPSTLKDDIITDVERFLAKDTKDWYNKHGIPYKRSYIFYGPPGTGKTSFIQALAGAYGRHVCFLQPNNPKFTDDMFKSCLQKAPEKSIIILEDIDALFNNRHSMNRSCPLTFTGLLNGLDGIGNAVGQLFVLSTNHLERLDPALIRSGRVDRKFEFSYCTDEALQLMFQRFYPETKLGEEFVAAVRSKTKAVTAADLQQAFIANMENSDKELLEYMDAKFDLGSREADILAAEEVDKKVQRERKLLELKEKKKAEAEQKALEEEAKAAVEKELGIEAAPKMEEKTSIPVESGSETDTTS
jgi:chaperone BCS1